MLLRPSNLFRNSHSPILRTLSRRLINTGSKPLPSTFRPSSRRLLVIGTLSLGAAGITLNATTDSPKKGRDEPLSSLLRSYFVYTLCSIPPVVTYSPSILAFTSSIPGLKQISETVVRYTFFNQFVGGDTAEQTLPLLEDLRAQNKGVLFAYSVEVDEKSAAGSSGSTGGQQYKKNVEEMIHSIDVAADFEDAHATDPRSALGRKTWVALKLTALVPSADALKHLSQYLINARPHDKLVHYPGTPTAKDLDILRNAAPPKDSTLSAEDLEALRTLKRDLERICQRGKERNVKVILDAEHTWYQPAIDAFQLDLMRTFNKRSKARFWRSSSETTQVQPLVYGTFQAYLRRTPAHIIRSLENAQREGYVLGVKLVRGAYHSQERKTVSPYEPDVVATRKYVSSKGEFPEHQEGPLPPVWDAKHQTDKAYNAAAAFLLDLLTKEEIPVGLLFGTHNKESCDLIIQGLMSRGLATTQDDRPGKVMVKDVVVDRIAFGQLYGMSDALTNYLSDTLVASSPIALKYIPYGALEDVIPYLGRRAIENQSVLGAKEGGAADERRIAGKKIWKRLFG